MPNQRKMSDEHAILRLFRELGLENGQLKEHFLQLARPSEWHIEMKDRYEPQDTSNNTAHGDSYAQLESAS